MFEGGAILAADSQASDREAQVRWEVEKPAQIGQFPCVVSISGSMGMADRVKADLLGRSWQATTFARPDRVRSLIDASYVKIYKAIEDRNRLIDLWGLAAFWAEGSVHILEHERSGDCCFHPSFHAIGSGAKTAYAIFRTLGGKDLVKLGEQKGVQVALRILRTCVGTEIAGVSDPFHMWLIRKDQALKLGDDRIQAELQYVDAWEARDRKAFFDA